MATRNPPYLSAYGTITKALERVKLAPTPDKFSQDFLATKLDLKGGSPKQVIPYLKRIGFLRSDGTPTPLYERFRNEGQSGAAVAEAMRHGYRTLYDVNEYLHDANDEDVRGVIIQVTGQEPGSKMVRAILGSFKALREFADFDTPEAPVTESTEEDSGVFPAPEGSPLADFRIGYTINLHLPATSDIAVFNAIFKSLRENLLR